MIHRRVVLINYKEKDRVDSKVVEIKHVSKKIDF